MKSVHSEVRTRSLVEFGIYISQCSLIILVYYGSLDVYIYELY
jgi:hypothetical protein